MTSKSEKSLNVNTEQKDIREISVVSQDKQMNWVPRILELMQVHINKLWYAGIDAMRTGDIV